MNNEDRVIPLEGIHNFRDYGGYQARSGRLRKGVLWRSGQHADATPADLRKVHELDIRTVIDLRGDSEREAYPCLRHADFSGDVVFKPGETAGLRGRAVHEESVGIVTARDAHEAMVRLYATLPWRPVLVGTYSLFLPALVEREGASLLHCFAGKDRTGVAAALVHSLLGVHDDDLMEDYLLTNVAGNIERRIEAGAKHLRDGHPDIEDAALRALMGVHPEFLETALAAIRERHGSVEGYTEEVLGFTPKMRDALAARLVE